MDQKTSKVDGQTNRQKTVLTGRHTCTQRKQTLNVTSDIYLYAVHGVHTVNVTGGQTDTQRAFLCKVGDVDKANIHRQTGRQTQSIVCTTSDASVFAVGGVIKVNINTQTGR